MCDKKKQLELEIKKHRFLYYTGNPIISDPEYDKLEKELYVLDPDNELFDEVGFKIEESTKENIKHKMVMPSLGKVYDKKEYNNGFKNVFNKVIVTPKIDGFAITLKYIYNENIKKHILKYGASRGNGKVGEDLTENVKQISDIKFTEYFPTKDDIEVRGEIYMKKSVFKEISEKAEKEDGTVYKTARNLAPGSVRHKNPLVTRERKLNFFVYDVIGLSDDYYDRLNYMKKNNWNVVSFEIINKENSEKYFNNWNNKRKELDFDIDGVVFRTNSNKEYNELGFTSHHPRGAIAWKFKSDEETTIYEGTEWQVSRTGKINPVGLIKPVDIGGATVKKVSLHNLTRIKDLNINIGDEIVVSRRGDVIPHIEKVLNKNSKGHVKFIMECPECNHRTYIIKNEDSDVEFLYCSNPYCDAIQISKIIYFVSCMGMKGIAESTIKKLYNSGYIKNFKDLFELKIEDFLRLDKFKRKSAEKTYNIIQNNREKTLDVFLRSLGISYLGKTVSKILSDKFNMDYILNNLREEELYGIDGIGDKMTKSIISEIQKRKDEIIELLSYITIYKESDIKGQLTGKTFCVTGTLSMSRNEIHDKIISNGGVPIKSVNKKLDYLIVGDSAGSKLDKAEKYGVQILTEDQFINLLGYDYRKDKPEIIKLKERENESIDDFF